jgi:glycosyltransferase involved in cell wall biosynthesis
VKWYAHYYPGLPRLIDDVQPDVIHLWEEPWSLVALQAAYLKGDAALVLEVDQNLIKRLPPPFEWIRRYVLRRTALVLSRSGEATSVVRAFGFAGPVRPIGYGVDERLFYPKTDPTLRPRGSLKVGYLGRLVEQKGVQHALLALTLVRSPVSLAIMGDGPYARCLRGRIQQLDLRERVNFRGWGGVEDTARFLRSLDVSILLSHSSPVWREQFGRSIIESQSCGVPVIGTASGAIPEVIGDGGWVIPEPDARALAALLERLSRAPEEISAKGELGLRNVRSRFTYEHIVQSLLTAWQEAAAARVRRLDGGEPPRAPTLSAAAGSVDSADLACDRLRQISSPARAGASRS